MDLPPFLRVDISRGLFLTNEKGDVGSKATYDFFLEDIWPRILP